MMDVLHWSGGRNVRDLGGRALRVGGCTPFGKVFRSAAPEHLTDEGWAAAKAAGVRTVVDLRNAPAETQRRAEHPIISTSRRAWAWAWSSASGQASRRRCVRPGSGRLEDVQKVCTGADARPMRGRVGSQDLRDGSVSGRG
ncbi:tyrosine-protein phosphatase [Dactylosporangium sp. NPDC049140]|uniref:tyrosine-protein phosphatase n=1 Tax=Dactylosporangium sp. NPDC049140 TaxID=3155647 RepID=UPI003411CFAC